MYTEVPAADLLSAGRFDERPGMTVYREHGARNWMISLTVSGSAEFRVADERVFTDCGDLVLIAPGVTQHYRARSAEPWASWWAHFQPRAAWFSWWRLPELAPGFSLTRFGPGHVRQAEAAFERVHRNAAQSTLDVPQGRMVSRG